jgi:hypothetical protein
MSFASCIRNADYIVAKHYTRTRYVIPFIRIGVGGGQPVEVRPDETPANLEPDTIAEGELLCLQKGLVGYTAISNREGGEAHPKWREAA